jgi:hypothetical protein
MAGKSEHSTMTAEPNKSHAPGIFAMLRPLSLNLFQAESSKISLRRKRMKAAFNDDDRAKVIFGMAF